MYTKFSKRTTPSEKENRLVVSRGWEERGVTANKHRDSFWGDKNVLALDTGDGCTQSCEYTKTQQILYCKKMNFMIRKLNSNFRKRSPGQIQR